MTEAIIDSNDHLHIKTELSTRRLGRVKPSTGRDRNPGVIFTPVSTDPVTGQDTWGDPIELPTVYRWTKEVNPKVSAEMVEAIMAAIEKLEAEELAKKARWFKNARNELGLTLSQLALILDTDPRTIRKWEAETGTNNRAPNPIAMRAMQWMLDGFRPPQWPKGLR